jgi:membrane protein YqaA with SNARE-associated domain
MSQHDDPLRPVSTAERPPALTLTARVERLSGKSYAAWALFGVAVVEGSIFPLPPDPLFIALSIGNPRKAMRFALIGATGSVLGSLIGYGIGLALFESVGRSLLSGLGVMDAFSSVLVQYREHGVMTLILSGFTPVPYALMTIAAGFNRTLPFATLVVGSVLGRAIRFGLLGGLLAVFGEPVKRYMETHRYAMAAAMLALSALALLFMRLLL